MEHAEIQAQLKALRATVDAIPIDVLRLWQAQNGQPARLETLMATAPTLEEQVATGITLLRRGLLVWKRDGARWIPKPLESLNDQALITRHLELITQVGAAVTHTIPRMAARARSRGGVAGSKSRCAGIWVRWNWSRMDWCELENNGNGSYAFLNQ